MHKSSKIILKTINARVILCSSIVISKLEYFQKMVMCSSAKAPKNIRDLSNIAFHLRGHSIITFALRGGGGVP